MRWYKNFSEYLVYAARVGNAARGVPCAVAGIGGHWDIYGAQWGNAGRGSDRRVQSPPQGQGCAVNNISHKQRLECVVCYTYSSIPFFVTLIIDVMTLGNCIKNGAVTRARLTCSANPYDYLIGIINRRDVL